MEQRADHAAHKTGVRNQPRNSAIWSFRSLTYKFDHFAQRSEPELSELRKRINATRWPERETVRDESQGVQLYDSGTREILGDGLRLVQGPGRN